MVVDDDKVIERMIKALVESHGCSTVSFNHPLEALRYYKENPQRITILVTDLTMPSISGPGLIRAVLNINPDLPIILITGRVEHIPGDIVPLVRHIVPKPFTGSQLLDVARTELVRAGHEHPSA